MKHLIPTRGDASPPATTEANAATPIWISHRVQVALVAAGLVLLLLAVWRVPDILTVAIGGGALALILSFPVAWLSRAMPRWLAVIVTLLLLLGALVLALVFLVPRLIDQLAQLLAAWPSIETSLKRTVDDAFQALQARGLLPADVAHPSVLIQQALGNSGEEIAGSALSGLLGLLSGTLGGLVELVAILTIAIYLVLDIDTVRNAFVDLAPDRYRGDAAALWETFGTSMRRYLGGVVVVAAITGILSGLALWILGVPSALLLSLWVAFTSLIPIFGTYIGIVPALPLALSVSPTTAALAVLAYVLIQQLQDNILTPRVQGETAHVHPVIVLLVVLWVGWAFGLFWSVLAVPALVAVSALVDFFRARVRIRPDPPITP